MHPQNQLLLILSLVVVAASSDWLEIGLALSRDLGEFGRSTQWEDAFNAAVSPRLPKGTTANQQVFVPFSGADVTTALAVNPGATEYILADRSPFFGLHHPLSWNASLLSAATSEAGRVFRTSHGGGYQLGHLVRAYSHEFGIVSLLLAVLKDRVVDVEEGAIRCRGFSVRYVSGDLYDPSVLDKLRLRKGSTVILKGTELALQQQRRTAEDFSGSSKVKINAILSAQEARNRAVRRLVDFILDVAGVLVQDYTGIPIQSLVRDERWTLYPFGKFQAPLVSSNHPDIVALGDFFSSRDTFDLGNLRFGYCQQFYPTKNDLNSTRGLPAFDDDDDHSVLRGTHRFHSARTKGRGRHKRSVASCHLVVARRAVA